MADFRPETTIQLYWRTGVDEQNQPYFTSEGAKLAWYRVHSPITRTAYSFQRENRNWIRIEGKAESLRDYDMFAFQNSEGSKWVFCKVEEVEFINPNCTEIRYSVDYMQTYIEDIRFGKCWVEREMQENDWDGSTPSFNNLQPEGIETGSMTRSIANLTGTVEFDSFSVVCVSKYNENGNPTPKITSMNNYPSGLEEIVFSLPKNGRLNDLENYISMLEEKGINVNEAIVGLFIVPNTYAGGSSTGDRTVGVIPPYPTINGYTVINAKCFTSEFFRLEISNRRGNEQELKPENFTETDTILLRMEYGFKGACGGSMLYPQGYEGNPKDFGVIKYDDAQAAFTSNAFTSWIAANTTSLGVSTANSIFQGAVTGAMMGAMAGPVGSGVGVAVGAAGAFLNVASTFAKIADRAKDPTAIGGQQAGSVMEILMDNYGYSVNWLHPYTANLRSIDQFFSRFGYRTNRFKKPNVDTRPKWNYVKTSDAVCRGPFPKKAQIYMQNIMNNGVTFWHLSGGENIDDDWDPEVNKE